MTPSHSSSSANTDSGFREQFKWQKETFWTICFLATTYCSGAMATLLLFYMFFYTKYYWLTILYAGFYIQDVRTMHEGGRPSEWVRDWRWWTYVTSYFPMTLIKTAELDPKKNCILVIFPHGVVNFSFVSVASNALKVRELFPGIQMTVAALDIIFYLPAMRELVLAMGCCATSRKSLDYLVDDARQGKAVLLYVGGTKDALLCTPGDCHVWLRSRKGFVKVAMANGAAIVPVFAFGQNEIYTANVFEEGSWRRMILHAINKIIRTDFPVFFGGTGLCGLLPKRHPISIVVGKPLTVEKIAEPSEEQVNKLHETFMEALTTLFEAEKHKYLQDAQHKSLVIH